MIGWLAKLAVIFALVGFVLFDAISVGITTASVADQGSYRGPEASATWDETKDVQTSYRRRRPSRDRADPLQHRRPQELHASTRTAPCTCRSPGPRTR